MTAAEIILALVTAQRGAELVLARRNTKALMAQGAIEIAAIHYPLLVVLHASWLMALWVFGHDQPVNVIALLAYLVLQGLRVWVMATLGPRWTTRIVVLPNAPLVTSGPYRLVRHPNYAVVIGEIAVLPSVLHLPQSRFSSRSSTRLCFSSVSAPKIAALRRRARLAAKPPHEPRHRHQRAEEASLSTWLGFLLMCLGMFMAILDIQVVATSLPAIQEALGISRDAMSWIQTAYLIAEITAIPLTGLLTRTLSLRWLFVAAISLFTAASIGCAASDNFATLICARVLQGFAGGALIRPYSPRCSCCFRRVCTRLQPRSPGSSRCSRRPSDRLSAAGSPRHGRGTGCF